MSYLLNGDRIIMGTDYYPEHWDEQLWGQDLDRMHETGIEVIRVAEFSWNVFEPAEGEYSYDFFDRFLDLCEEKNMKVIFCTPTATPPAWMTDKYPEVLNARQDGVLYRHGARRHYNYNSVIYQRFTRNIVERLGAHYAKRACIIGWQLDNEINCEKNEFYSESDTLAFREFLKAKYGSIRNLNKAWGTAFWNQTYTAWGEVYVPRTTLSNNTNPHEVLDYKRFVSDSACRWAKLQSDILRKYVKPGDFITTNGLFADLDNHRMTRDSLDFMTYDSYPNMAYGIHSHFTALTTLKDRIWGLNLDEVRALKGTFGIMEQQSGANGWNTGMEAPTPRPGQITLWTMQSIAHGADYISYFRWRTSTMGTEIYWHGILDYSGRENRRIREVREIHDKFVRMSELAGTQYEAKVGIIETYDNKFDAELDEWHGALDRMSMNGLYAASQHTHTPVDLIYLPSEESDTSEADDREVVEKLSQHRVVFYPHAVILTERQVRILTAYVEQGGTLVFGCRAGLKDPTGKCVQQNLPGVAAKLTGADVTEFTLTASDERMIHVDWNGTTLEAPVFNDELQPLKGAKTAGTYKDSYYTGTPALIENSVGKGKVYYFGGCFSEQTAAVFFEKLDVIEPYQDIVEAPAGCEIALRTGKDRPGYLFVLNYEKTPQSIQIKRKSADLYTGEELEGERLLAPYETLVLKA